MDPSAAINTCFSKYAHFDDRATLPEIWWWALFVGVIGSVLFVVTPVLSGLFLLATLVPFAAVAARRLHDTNRSAWWTLLTLILFPGLPFLAALLVFQGTKGRNRFGPDPLGREATGPMPPMPEDSVKSVAEWQDRR